MEELPPILFLTSCNHETYLECFVRSVESHYEDGTFDSDGIPCFQFGCESRFEHNSILSMKCFGIFIYLFSILCSRIFSYRLGDYKEKFETILLNKTLGTMDDVMYCQRNAVYIDILSFFLILNFSFSSFTTIDFLVGDDGHQTCPECFAKPAPLTSADAQVLQSTKQCPSCKFRFERTGGCNHMTCSRCRAQFCCLPREKY